MGKYSGSTTQQASSIRKTKEPHPIWRGIGCVMMIIVPAVSIIVGKGIVDLALKNRLRLPPELLGIPQLPAFLYKLAGLKPYLIKISIPNLYAYIVASIICIMLISSVVSLIYAVIYRMANPNRYGPMDEPPPRIKAKKHSR
jgi:hypothetical protein